MKMMKLRNLTLFAVAVVSVCGCASILMRHPNVKQTLSATEYFFGLLEKGQVPGMAKGELGRLTDEGVALFDTTVSYPISRRFTITKAQDPDNTYSYVLRKERPDSDWIIVEAWREHKTGNRENLMSQGNEHELPTKS
jgi:hypothetical protein